MAAWARQDRAGRGRALESRVTRSARPGITEQGQARLVEAEVGRLLGAYVPLSQGGQGGSLWAAMPSRFQKACSLPRTADHLWRSLLRPAFPTKHGSNSLGQKVSLLKARQEFN